MRHLAIIVQVAVWNNDGSKNRCDFHCSSKEKQKKQTEAKATRSTHSLKQTKLRKMYTHRLEKLVNREGDIVYTEGSNTIPIGLVAVFHVGSKRDLHSRRSVRYNYSHGNREAITRYLRVAT